VSHIAASSGSYKCFPSFYLEIGKRQIQCH
jgi:hypothetical protein